MLKVNKLKKIAVIFGTRPEAIKMAPVIKELQKYPDVFRPLICVTAQHREMLDQVLKLFAIVPHCDLNIMEDNQSIFEVTAKGLLGIRGILETEKPAIVLVQGDTTTAFAVSLASFYLKIPLGHIEAGLRTDEKYKPFPEEINRQLISVITDLHFVPTQRARLNLLRQGIAKEKIFVTGNTVIDALFYVLKKIGDKKGYDWPFPFLESKLNRLILVTAHRRESFGKPLKNICYALKEIVKRDKSTTIVYPVHPNPNIQNTVRKILGNTERIHLIAPLDYLHFVYLMSRSYLILTDSGGMQEEAPSLGKPVLIMRDNTERPEGIEAGVAKLVGTKIDNIVENVENLLNNREVYETMARVANPFGDGKGAQRIVDVLLNWSSAVPDKEYGGKH